MINKLYIKILAVNSKYIHSALAPWCLVAGLKMHCKYPLDISIFEGTINEELEVVAKKACEGNPDVMGISVYIWNKSFIKKLLPLIIKHSPKTIIILGGPEVSFNPYEVLQLNKQVDYVVSGEGEIPFANLISLLIEGKVQKIDGVSYRENDKIIISEPFEDNNEFVSAISDDYIKNLKGRIAYMESQRGCPYSCSFCLSGRNNKLRFLPMERVFKDMLALSESGTKTIKFVDRTFNSNKKRAIEIINFISDNYGKTIPSGVCFHFEIAADILEEELLNALKRLPRGAVQLEAGLQSFNKKTLMAINRKTDLLKLEENVKKIISYQNIHLHIDLIAGLPYESLESFLDGFDAAYKIKPQKLQLGFLKLLHGSPMDKQNVEGNYSLEPPYEVIETPYITKEELITLHKMEDTFERIYSSGRFKRTLDYVFATSNIKPSYLFMSLGNELTKTKNISLFDYTKKLLSALSCFPNINQTVVRDMMAWDYIATNSSGNLPPCLKIYDSRLRQAKKSISKRYPQMKGIKRGVVVLCSENCAVFADYTECDILTGEYKTIKINLEEMY